MGKLDKLSQGILSDIGNNVLKQDDIIDRTLSKSAQKTVGGSTRQSDSITQERDVSRFLNNPEFEKFENQNRILKLIYSNLSDEINDASLLRKILIIENLKIINEKGFETPFKALFDEKDTRFTLTADDETGLATIKTIDDRKFLQTLMEIYETLADVYDARQNHRYKASIKYKDDTIKQSTILRNYTDTTKRKDYDNGSLVLDLTRGIKLEQQQKIDDEVFSVVLMIEEEVRSRKANVSFDEQSFLFNKIKMITGESGLPDKNAKKADVLNRFAHQMFSAEVLLELMTKIKVLGAPEASKPFSVFFSSKTPKETPIQGVISSTLVTNHRIIEDLDTKQNYVEIDMSIPVINVGDYYVCFDSDHRSLKWIPAHQINSKSELLKYKEPIIHVRAKTQLLPNPSYKPSASESEKENEYYLKFKDFDIELFSPDLKPSDLLSQITHEEKDIPKKGLQKVTEFQLR